MENSIFGKVIHSYSRQNALDDGCLVDVSEVARKYGIRFPVAVTNSVYAAFAETEEDDGTTEHVCIENMVRVFRSQLGGCEDDTLLFGVHAPGSQPGDKMTSLKAVIAPGDNYEPVITIMMPEED